MLFLIIFLSAIILSAAFPWAILYIFRLKKDIRATTESLQKIKQDTNLRLKASSAGKDVSSLAYEINEILDQQKGILMEQEKTLMENEQMNHEIRQGMANILNDLRTPLTSASGYIGLIKSDEIDEDKKREYLDLVDGRLVLLVNLMSELTDNMQMVEGKVELELEPFDLCHLVREEIASFNDALATGNFQVSVDIPDTPVQLMTDPSTLQRVVQDLIGNTLKHGIDQLLVKISSDAVMTFTNKVADVKGLEVESLFERFYTAETPSQNQKIELNLGITKALVEQIGGEISASLDGDMLSIKVEMNKEEADISKVEADISKKN